MFPLIHVSFIGQNVTLVVPPSMESATLSDLAWRQAYKQAVIEVVEASRPLYLSIGNEVNRWYEKYGMGENNPNGFQHFISLYKEIYDAVKELSPQTNVFCTFAREIVSENRETNLTVLSMFSPENMDLLVFTSYPYAVQGINLHLLGWAWLHDIDQNDYLGLIKRDGTEKLAYQVWKNLSKSS